MQTVVEAINARIEELRLLLREFLIERSVDPRDITTPSDPFVLIGPRHAWGNLNQDGRRLQSRLLTELGQLHELVRALLKTVPADAQKKLDEAQGELRELVDQSDLTWVKTKEEALTKAERALDTQLELITHLYDASEGDPIFVPDTNALAWNPDLEIWSFDGAPRFTIAVTATVLGELDRLKVEHRNPEFRVKAEGLINRLKSYRGRGNLSRGVVLRRDISVIRTIAVEPDVAGTLSWLDPGNDDDRILASLIEVMRGHPRTPVVLVTRDINLQNKAEYAGLPFVEPPDPAKP